MTMTFSVEIFLNTSIFISGKGNDERERERRNNGNMALYI